MAHLNANSPKLAVVAIQICCGKWLPLHYALSLITTKVTVKVHLLGERCFESKCSSPLCSFLLLLKVIQAGLNLERQGVRAV